MKDKYADQDDEEREVRMQLLGAKKVKGFELPKKKIEIPKEEPEEEEEAEAKVPKEAETVEEVKEEAEIVEAGEEEEVLGEKEGEEEDDEEEEKGNEEDEKKEIEQLMKEEDINMVPEDIDLAEIDKLTGIPKGNDIVLALVPMCAPYTAIQTYKYKVKLQAGTLKRGKAQKLIKNLFT